MTSGKKNLANILVVGSGGREHALAWKFAQSQRVGEVFVAPGNAGMFSGSKISQAVLESRPVVVADQPGDLERVIRFCKINDCELVVVGPEGPLGLGVVDALQESGIRVFGPTKAAARLETSKAFARRILEKAGVPSPEFLIAHGWADLHPMIEVWPWPEGMVIKVDGLASGKGVFVCKTREDAGRAVASLKLMDEASGGALSANGFVCEEALVGREVSAFVLCDGRDFLSFGMACDHKRLLDGDRGPNTGGMGAYSPVHWLNEGKHQKITDAPPNLAEAEIDEKVFRPVLKLMDETGSPFRGFLFAGLMMTSTGPKVLEFNVRLGDPETQVLLPRLNEDLFEVIMAATDGRLKEAFPDGLQWSRANALHVVKAAAGYPGIDGAVIRSGDPVFGESKHLVFYSGVASSKGQSGLETSGGRVLGVTVMADDLNAAHVLAYEAINEVNFDGAQWRTDIGK
jgi:phosphoribosylamine--glycine ligase